MKRRAASLIGGRLSGLIASSEEACYSNLQSSFLAGNQGSKAHKSVTGLLQLRAAALPAQQVATKLQPDVVPLTRIDEVGAISIIEPHEKDFVPKEFENVDGRRIEDGRYAAFIAEVSGTFLLVVQRRCQSILRASAIFAHF